MEATIDDAAIRAAVLARLERRGFAPERAAGGDAAPAPGADIFGPFAVAVFASAVAWMLWHGLLLDPAWYLSANPLRIVWPRAWAVVFGLAALCAAVSFVDAVLDAALRMCRAGDREGCDG